MTSSSSSSSSSDMDKKAQTRPSSSLLEGLSDVLRLNVGGTKIDVLRRTLTIIDGSLLATRFNGRWDDNLEKDSEGNFYIDQNPHLFMKLIEYLRNRSNEGIDTPIVKPPKFILDEDNQNFYSMISHYAMRDDIYPVRLWSKSVWGGGPLKVMNCHPNVKVRCDPNSEVYLLPTVDNDRYFIRSVTFSLSRTSTSSFSFGWADRNDMKNNNVISVIREMKRIVGKGYEYRIDNDESFIIPDNTNNNNDDYGSGIDNNNYFIIQTENLGIHGLHCIVKGHTKMLGNLSCYEKDRVPFVSGPAMLTFTDIEIALISKEKE